MTFRVSRLSCTVNRAGAMVALDYPNGFVRWAVIVLASGAYLWRGSRVQWFRLPGMTPISGSLPRRSA